MFVSKKRFVEILKELNEKERQNECLQQRYDMLQAESQEQSKSIVDLQMKIEKMEEYISKTESAYGDSNTVKMIISDDLTHVVPHITVKVDMFEKMIELGLISDSVTTEAKPFAMQLALLSVAAESLDQLLANFETKIEKVD